MVHPTLPIAAATISQTNAPTLANVVDSEMPMFKDQTHSVSLLPIATPVPLDAGMAAVVESTVAPIPTAIGAYSSTEEGRGITEDKRRDDKAKSCSLRWVGMYILGVVLAVIGVVLIFVIVNDGDGNSTNITTQIKQDFTAPSAMSSFSLPSSTPSTMPPSPPPSSAPSVSPTLAPSISPTHPSPSPVATGVNGERPLKLNAATTYSKRGNRRTCGWDICPSFRRHWPIAKLECHCVGGLDSCYLDGNDMDVEGFGEVLLLPVSDGKEEIFKMVGDGPTLALGEGWDCASGSRCFDDPLRGGFVIDLTGTDYVFDASTNVTVTGWALVMQLYADGAVQATSSGAHGPQVNHMLVTDGTKRLTVVCGGWSGGCTLELYVKKTA